MSDLEEKYTIEQKRENIKQFVNNNSNQYGIDLTKLYLGKIVYNKDLDIDPVEKQFANKIAIVYIFANSENSYIYMDLFREKLLQTLTYSIPGVLSFSPFVRKGLSIIDLTKLSDLLELERLPLEKIKKIYDEIEKINYYDLFGMTVNDFHNLYDNENRVKKY